MTRTALPALTSLRFFAAALIVVHHTVGYFNHGRWLSENFAVDQGVSFFFVLSGFVLRYRYGEINNANQAVHFWVARVARIWPIHATMLAIVLVFTPYPWGYSVPGMSFPPLASNLLLLQSWRTHPTSFFSFNSVSWSISTEMFFYLMFPLLAKNWSSTARWKLLLTFAGTALMVMIATKRNVPFLVEGIDATSIDALVYIFPLARLFEFTLGIAAADIYSRIASRILAWSARNITLAQLSAALAVAATMHLMPLLAAIGRYHNVIGAPAQKWLVASGSAPVFAVLLVTMAFGQGSIARMLSHRPLVVLGEISFSVYMTHLVLFTTLVHRNQTLALLESKTAQMLVYWALVLTFSYALWTLVEKPCRIRVVDAFQRLYPRTSVDAPGTMREPSIERSSL